MSRPQNPIPSLNHHKPSNRARVRIEGKDFYLGPWGSAEAQQRYGQIIADLAAGKLPEFILPTSGNPQEVISVSELVLAFKKHAESYYIGVDGKPTDEIHCYRSALKPLQKLYGSLPVDQFGPLALRAVREQMIQKGWTRGYVNKSINRIRHVFKWGVSHEMVPAATLEALKAVEGLKAGKTTAPDPPKRKPVPQEHIQAVQSAATKQRTRDLIELQLLTAARPGEILVLTTNMFDRTGDVWVVKFNHHKTAHRGKDRTLYFGPQSQLILRRYLNDQQPDQRLFSLRGDSYSLSLRKICDRLGIPRFCPHRLRHTAATRLRKEYGLEIAQVILGHSKADVTEIYAAKNHEAAITVARNAG